MGDSTQQVKPIHVWSHWGGPNPMKVSIILEALSLPYEAQVLEFTEVKTDAYLNVTPNGRLPTIHDPNTGLTLWETGAIIQYLVEQYDVDGKISYKTMPDKYLTQQWLAFQISGQGPYVGQAAWFLRFHPEKLESAIDRYTKEILRIAGVVDLGLERNGTGWLVGDRCTYADLSFVTWGAVGEGILKQLGKYEGFQTKYPRYTAWMKKMDEREEVKLIKARMAKGRADHGLPP